MNEKKLMKKDAATDQQQSTPKKGGAQIRNLRNFGITLGISFVILGIVAIFAARFVANTVCDVFTGDGAKDLSDVLTPVETTNPSGEKQDERFTRELSGSSFTWLMVITDKRPSVYDYFPDKNEIKNIDEEDAFGLLGKNYRYVGTAGIVLVHANVNLREYTVMAIPPITRVETGSGDYNLSEIYSYFGMDFLKAKVEGLTGMTVDQYTVLNCTDLVSLANVIGGIDCKIPVDIYSNGPLYVSKPPQQSDTEEDEAASEDAPVYKVELEKTDVVKLSAKLEAALLYSDYEGLKNKFRESSLDQSVVKDAAEVIQAYSWLEVQTLVYPGRFVPVKGSQGAYYNPDVEGAVQYFYKYR